MEERYLTSFEDQTTALGYTSGDTTLVSPQVSLVGVDEVVYTKKIPNDSKVRFAKDEATGKLYFVVDGVYYDALTLKKAKIPLITYGEVDLGLPSGTIWADRNVGAETPQDNGAYFSWGNTEGAVCEITKISEDDLIRMYLIYEEGVPAETITQEMIDTIKLQYGENLKTVIEEYLKEHTLNSEVTFDWATTPYYNGVNDYNKKPLFSKYNKTDGLTVLEASDDAATVNMSGDWRMPTIDEISELIENSDHYYIGKDGNIVAGPFDYTTDYSDKGLDGFIKLRSICFVKQGEAFDYNNRSNFIEFPFAGYCDGSLLRNNRSVLLGDGSKSDGVWSSSVYDGSAEYASLLIFDIFGFLRGSGGINCERYIGYPVRGVRA